MPLIGNLLEQLEPYALYSCFDTFETEPGKKRLALFDKPIGHKKMPGVMQSYADTNMQLPSQLPAPQRYLLHGFEIELTNSPSEMALKSFLWRAMFVFMLGQKLYWQCPVADLFFNWKERNPRNIYFEYDDAFSCYFDLQDHFAPNDSIAGRVLMHGSLFRGIQ